MKSDSHHIIQYYFKRLNKNAHGIEKDFNEEAIHLFRIDVKKLRAFLRMLRIEAEEPSELKFPSRFKKMYSLTGKIRDRQLYMGRLTEINKKNDNRLHRKIASLKQDLEELKSKKEEILTKKEFKEVEEKIQKHVSRNTNETLIKKFFFQKQALIKEIIACASFKDKELHNLRKNLKDIIYIISLFRDDLKTPIHFLSWDKAAIKRAEDLSHSLGQFNDTCIALSFLMPAEIKKADTNEKDLLLLLRRQWLAQKRKLKKEILNKIPEIKWEL